jgi:hypothetical protein
MANNLAQLNKNSLTFSSETSGFEAANAFDSFRSNTWKAAGHFEISDGSATYDGAQNDQLYIDDGSPVTVTITAGQYTTAALLATQIQTDLNAASSNWTCTYDLAGGTYKFTIGNSGSVDLTLSSTTNAIWDTLGYTSSTDQTGTSFVANEPRNHTSEYLRLDMGYQAAMTFIGCIGDVATSFGLSNQANVTLKGNNIDTNWGSPAFSATLTVTNKGIFSWNDTSDDARYRFWRFEYEDKYNSTSGPNIEIGSLYLGSYQCLVNRNITSGFNDILIDPSIVSESQAGVRYFDERTKYTAFSNVVIPFMDETDKDEIKDLFDNVGLSTPFYISLDPLTNFSSDITDFTKYVVFQNAPIIQNSKNCRWSTVLNLQEVL